MMLLHAHPYSRRRRLPLLAMAFAGLATSACSGETTRIGVAGEEEGAYEPLRSLNASPSQPREFRVIMKEPPGPLPEVDAAVQYDVINAAPCGKKNWLSGASPGIRTSEAVELTKVSDTEYVGVVYDDLILDEDYFGRGVCNWAMVEVRVSFRASTDQMATWFVASLGADAFDRNESTSKFFWSGYYPNAEIDGYAEFGNVSLEHVPDDKKSEFFEIVMSPVVRACLEPPCW